MLSIIYVFIGLIEFGLAFRFVFLLFGVSASTPIVGWMYNATDPFMIPFAGWFREPRVNQGTMVSGIFEISTLIALAVYAIIGLVLIRLAISRTQQRKDH